VYVKPGSIRTGGAVLVIGFCQPAQVVIGIDIPVVVMRGGKVNIGVVKARHGDVSVFQVLVRGGKYIFYTLNNLIKAAKFKAIQ
ncbi:MAG: hypothetical protein EA391_05395, partial [Balneolaceae bacterium]